MLRSVQEENKKASQIEVEREKIFCWGGERGGQKDKQYFRELTNFVVLYSHTENRNSRARILW